MFSLTSRVEPQVGPSSQVQISHKAMGISATLDQNLELVADFLPD